MRKFTKKWSSDYGKLLFKSLLLTCLVFVSGSSFAITGAPVVCVGSTTALTDPGIGGVWSSSNGMVATVGTSGIVTGVAAGVATISYTIAGIPLTVGVTVNPVPSGIGGAASVCNGATITLSDFTSGGNWTSTAGVSVTTGATTTTVTGLTNGPNTITYSLGSGCYRTYPVTVKALPTSILGTLGVCTSGVSFLSDATTLGMWTISPVGTATISPSGRVYGVSAGAAVVTYTGPNACITTATVTVTAAPTAITGNAPVCPASTVTLIDATGGGSWTSGNTAIATVGSDGTLTGIAAGTCGITYSTGAGCSVMTIATVNLAPNAGSLSGSATACTGSTTSFSDAVMGGIWSSANPATGTVNTFGVVRGLAVGTTTISYTVTNSCGSAAATAVVTVGLGANAGTITGNAPFCAGSTLALSDAMSGGVWTSNNPAVGTVDAASGSVTGIAGGSAIIYYTVTNSCGSASTSAMVSVNAFTAGTITGTPLVIAGLTTLLADVKMGGVWSVSNSNASVSGTGLVTGLVAGTVTVSYTVTNGCGSISATYVVTVNASTTAPIIGLQSVCVGTTTSLIDITPGGVWSSSNSLIASVGTSGVVTGNAVGTATIYYTVAGVPAAAIVTVNANPSGIGGATSVCNGLSISLSDLTPGGTWTSTAGLSLTGGSSASTVSVTGLVNGLNTITYSLGSGCSKTYNVTVKAPPTSILGVCVICSLGSVTFLSDLTAGISWTWDAVGVLTVSPSGRVYGVSAGTANVTYTATNNCITTTVVSVNPAPIVAAITGANNVSHGATIALSDLTPGGNWSSSNPAIGSVDNIGNVTGVGTSGVVIISYTIDYPSATCAANSTKSITVHTPAPPTHGSGAGGMLNMISGSSATLDEDLTSSEWTSSNTDVATVEEGLVMAIGPGNASITHVGTNSTGAISSSITQVVVDGLPLNVNVIPNPNNGAFTIKGTTGSTKDEELTLEVTNVVGRIVYSSKVTAMGGNINETVSLSGSIASGMYMLNVRSAAGNKTFHFVMEK